MLSVNALTVADEVFVPMQAHYLPLRGLEKLPKGPLIVAAKHQSTWETFALLRLFDDFAFVVKRELMWIPIDAGSDC